MVKIGCPSMSGAFEPVDWSTSKRPLNFIQEYFNGDWRKGQDIQKIVITQRLYQTSADSTQA